MRNWIKVLLKISLIVLIVGIVLGSFGFVLRKGRSFGVAFENGKIVTSDERNIVVSIPKTDLESFDNAELNVSCADVEIITTEDEYAIEYTLENSNPTYDVSDGKLTFDQVRDDSVNFNMNFDFSSSDNNVIKIYVPADAISSLVIDNSKGDVTINDISLNSIELTMSYGDVECSNINVEESLKIESSYGDVTVNNGSFNTVEADLSYGDIKFENTEISDSASINDSCGDIEIDLNNGECSYDIDTSCGDIEINGVEVGDGVDCLAHNEVSDGATLTISDSYGDVSINY